MQRKDVIDFDQIKKYVNIESPELFLKYLKEVYKDLADREEANKKKGIGKLAFLDYLKLPIFISEKLFDLLDKDKDGFLSSREFIIGMNNLYNSPFEDALKIVFDLLDFNHDGQIEKDDIRIFLSLLPLKTDRKKIEYKYQMESLDEIRKIIDETFEDLKVLDFNDFQSAIRNKKADIFLQIICFLYQKKPFCDTSIQSLIHSKKKLPDDLEEVAKTPCIRKLKNDNILLRSPLGNTTLSPIASLMDSKPLPSPFSLGDSKPEENVEISGLQGMVRYNNRNIPNGEGKANNEEVVEGEESNQVKEVLKNSTRVRFSPSHELLNRPEGNSSLTPLNPSDNDSGSDKKTSYSNYIYKVSENGKLKKYYVSLIDKDLYYYKNQDKTDLLGMHNLSGCFFKEYGSQNVNDKLLFCFSVIFPKKERKYYCESEEIYQKFVYGLKTAFGYLNFFDYYDMLDDLGEGIFGSVKLGVEKKTKERVAIKIIKKKKAKDTDIALVRTEIDIMKLCYHPNVVRLLDHFENADYIFIVMEYIKGGSLTDYMKKNSFSLPEKRCAELIYQIAKGLQYLHKYGIIHRDLKPDNIMLTDSSDKGSIKIMDFGLSKILGKKEKTVDGFGTLTFVSPEVLVRKPYNKEIDIWSLGVILFLMLSGDLPFDDPDDDEQKIAKSIVFSELKFPEEKFGNKSSEVIDLIKGCLMKEPKQRFTIEKVLKSDWIKNNVETNK